MDYLWADKKKGEHRHMDLFALVASSGGGIIGAYMGALPAFILTGAIAIAGAVAAMTGGADITVGLIAFGSYLGPYIAFAGGVAVSVYAGKTERLGSGTDILFCLNGLVDSATLLVGGVFGVIGFLVHYVIGTVLHPNTDLPGFTVTISAVVARLVSGSSGLIGKTAPDEAREYFTDGKGTLYNVILGLGIGITTGFVCQMLVDGGVSAVSTGSYPALCFGITAVSLISAQTGPAMLATHRIALVSALTAITVQNPVMGVVFGILALLFGDFIGKTFNSCCDTHIDPPTFTILIFTFIVNVLFGSELFSV